MQKKLLFVVGPHSNWIFIARKRSLGQGNVFTPGVGWIPNMHHRSHDQGGSASRWVGRTPPRSAYTGVWADSPKIYGILRDTVNKWAVRILLECFLVKQECIPVGCVPHAHWLYLIVSAMHTPATHAPHPACPPCHACPLPRTPPPRTPPPAMLRTPPPTTHPLPRSPPPPVNRMTDRFKNITFAYHVCER